MIARIIAIVQFYGLIPVIFAAEGCEAVIAGSLGRKLDIGGITLRRDVERRGEELVGDIVIIIIGSEKLGNIISHAEILDTGWRHIGMIETCGMVGHKIY